MKNAGTVTAVMLFGVGTCLIVGCQEVVDSSNSVTPVPPSPSELLVNHEPAKPTEEKSERPLASEFGPWPKVLVPETEYTFGRMSVGGEKEHVFTIQNDGEADLELQAGDPTCKCTAFELSKTSVKPGESAELLVRWHGKFKDASFQHGGPVFTNDPKKSEVRFAVKGIVDANIEMLPNELWSVGNVSESENGTMQAVVLSRVHDSFQVTEVTSESPFVTTEVVPVPTEKLSEYEALSAWFIKVTVSSEMPPGILEADLKISVDCEENPVTVSVTAQKSGPIRVLPTPGVVWVESANGLKMEQFSATKGREVELTLLVEEPEGTEPLQFTSVESTPSFIEVGLEPAGKVGTDKARYKMKIKIPPGIPRSSRQSSDPGRINIQTNHPSGQNLNIKVTYKAF